MKRIVVVLSSVMALIALSVTLGGAAWSATVPSSTPSSTPIIIFDDVGQQAQLIIPTPACPETQPDCMWRFFLNLPKLHIDVATVYGTSGTLSIPYPPNFCGVIQADAYVGPPWVAKRGFQHTINNCEPPPDHDHDHQAHHPGHPPDHNHDHRAPATDDRSPDTPHQPAARVTCDTTGRSSADCRAGGGHRDTGGDTGAGTHPASLHRCGHQAVAGHRTPPGDARPAAAQLGGIVAQRGPPAAGDRTKPLTDKAVDHTKALTGRNRAAGRAIR